MRRLLSIVIVALFSVAATCDEGGAPVPSGTDAGVTAADSGEETPDGGDVEQPDVGMEEALSKAQVAFDFGEWTIPPGGEQYPCAQWTLNNDEPLYVQAVVQANRGGWHHSNWYAVDEEQFTGPDGIQDCDELGFSEREGAVFGAVVFAQSTQAYVERQALTDGVVIKIPPRSKIIGGAHLLNVSSTPLTTTARMGLELLHPRDVKQVAVPWRLDNSDLRIPGESEVRFDTTCSLKPRYEQKTGEEFAPKIYWILPHYHALGNYFRVDVVRPDGEETIVELEGFNAEANGIEFDPPIDLTGATGLRFSCGYFNPYPTTTWYGLTGDDEMCTLLAFTDAQLRLNTSVFDHPETDTVDGIETKYGDCSVLWLPNTVDQALPTPEEVEAPLYVPEGSEVGEDFVVPECVDQRDGVEPDGATTLGALRVDVFGASCAYSSCHDADSPAAGLDLTAEDLHAELLEHEVRADTSLPLVDPGNPEGSWLYRITSECEPQTDAGAVAFMPRNSPTLMPPGKVARIRQWIADGAPND